MKRNIAFCFCCLLAAGLASEAWAALPASAYRCASQLSTAGTVKVDFTVHAGTADISQVILNFSVRGRTSDVVYGEVTLVLPGGASKTLTGETTTTSISGDYDGWTLQFSKLSTAPYYDYQLVISPETYNSQWHSGSSLTSWRVTVGNMGTTSAFQFNARIIPTPTVGEAFLTGVTPDRQLTVNVQNAPAPPIAVNETKGVTFSDDGLSPRATLHMNWNPTPVPGFPGTVAWATGSADPTGTGVLEIHPTSEPSAETVYKLNVVATDSIANAASGNPIFVTSTDVSFTVKNPTPNIAPPTGLRIKVSAFIDGDMEFNNLGGGTIDIASVALPAYNPASDHGYFIATFDNVSGGYDFSQPLVTSASGIAFGAPRKLHIRFIPIVPSASITTVSFMQTLNGGTPGTTSPASQTVTGTGLPPDPQVPLDIVAVMDRSGSMSEETNCAMGLPEYVKIEGLHAAGGLFYDIMDAIHVNNQDRTGLVSYNQNPVLELADGVISGPITTSVIGQAKAKISTLQSMGSTSISRALETAVSQFTSPDTVNKAILLVTDGMHNTPSYNFEGDFNPAGGAAALQHIKMYVVGLGKEGNLNAAVLQRMAASDPASSYALYHFEPGGYRHTCTSSRLAIYFAQILADQFFEANIITDDPVEVPVGGPAVVRQIPVNTSAREVVFYVTASDPGVKVSFTLSDPEGNVQERSLGGDHYAWCSMPMHYFAEKYRVRTGGEWAMTITARYTGSGPRPQKTTLEYAALSVDPVVHASFGIDTAAHATGDPITLTAALTEGGAPIRGAQAFVYADVPAVGLGDFIYANQVSGDVQVYTEPGPANGAQQTPEARKLSQLLAQMPQGLSRLVLELPMNDAGTGGDRTAGDGVYTLTLASLGPSNPTENNGIYTFTFKARGTTLLGEAFERTKALSDYVTSVPSAAHSQAAYSCGSNGSTAVIRVTLRDRFGHFVDPVPGRSLRVSSLRPSVLDFVADVPVNHLNGDTVITLRATKGSFSPYLETQRLIGIDTGGFSKSTVSVPVRPPSWLLSLEVFGGLYALQPALSINSGVDLGLRGRLDLGPFFGIEPELGITQTADSHGTGGHVFDYGVRLLVNPPLTLFGLRPYLAVGGGGTSFLGFVSESTTWTASAGAGLRWYPYSDRPGAVSLEARDLVLFNAYNTGITHNLQVNLAIHASLGGRE